MPHPFQISDSCNACREAVHAAVATVHRSIAGVYHSAAAVHREIPAMYRKPFPVHREVLPIHRGTFPVYRDVSAVHRETLAVHREALAVRRKTSAVHGGASGAPHPARPGIRDARKIRFQAKPSSSFFPMSNPDYIPGPDAAFEIWLRIFINILGTLVTRADLQSEI
jgi:hypothetical protein